MSRRNLYWLLGITASLGLVGFFMLGYAAGFSRSRTESMEAEKKAELANRDNELVRLVVDVLHEVDSKYVTDLDPERKRKLVEDMINGGLERLDPHSVYINREEFKQYDKQNRGKIGGIGINLGYDRGRLIVISPIPGMPAYKADVLSGDAIVKIDGKATEGVRLNEAIDLIQGDPGQQIVLSVIHEGGKGTVEIPMVRKEIKIPSVMGDLRDPKDPEKWDFLIDHENRIGYLRVSSFSEKSGQDVTAALKELKDKGMRGFVLDLRGNPGGLLGEAVNISNLFLKEGDGIVSTKGRNSPNESFVALSEDELLQKIYRNCKDVKDLCAQARGVTLQPAERFPVVVLIDRYSAAASEIVSAALKDHGRAIICGERSYGKGSVQKIIPMGNDKDAGALKLTTASYLRPSGKNTQRFPHSKETDEWGVEPSPGMEVRMKDEERAEYMIYRRDRDNVRSRPKEMKPDEKTMESKDRMLEKALEYLRAQGK